MEKAAKWQIVTGGNAMSVVVIPAYKPDETLVSIADQLWALGGGIIVVDDGSGEEYRSVFDRISDICIILRHSKNCGKGAAIKTALDYIRNEMWGSDVIGIMDADGQHLAKDMWKLLKFAGAHRKTLVLGTRKVGKDMPLKSRLGNQITKAVYRFVSGVNVSDTQTGLRAFGAELIEELLSVEGERYEYEMNVLLAFAKAKIPIKEIRASTIYHDRGNSCSHFRALADSARIYKDIFKFMLSSFSGFVVDYLVFFLLMAILPHTGRIILLANIFARVVSAFYNYCMNCRFLFYAEKKIRTAAPYFALAAAILAMNNLILEMFVQTFHLSVYPAKLLTECLLFCFSLLFQKYVIFRKEKLAAREEGWA